MRITPQQLQIQLQDIKTQGKPVKLNPGSILQGKVLAVQADAIMIQLTDGATLRAVVDASERFVEGDNLSFKVAENETSDLPKLEIIEKSGVDVKSLLNKVDIKPTPENVKAYEVLKSMDLNVSKENIELMTKNFQFVSKVNDTIEQILPKEMKVAVDMKMSQVLTKEMAPEVLEKVSQSLDFESVEAFKNADLKTVVIKALNLPVPEEVDQAPVKEVPESKVNVPKEVIKEVFGLIRDAGDKLELTSTMEKLGQLLKLNKPLNFKSMTVLDKLTFEEGKISGQVKTLIKSLEPEQRELLSLLKGFEPNKLTTEKAVSDYFNELLSTLKEAEGSVSSRVKGQITQLAESIQFLEQTQEDVTWLQIPMQINKDTQNVDIYFKNDKKEGKKLTKDNAKILVALNTTYLDTVQAFIKVKGHHLSINFRVQHESVKQLIEANKDVLSDYFDMYDAHILVENKSKMTFSDFVEEDSMHHFDVKV